MRSFFYHTRTERIIPVEEKPRAVKRWHSSSIKVFYLALRFSFGSREPRPCSRTEGPKRARKTERQGIKKWINRKTDRKKQEALQRDENVSGRNSKTGTKKRDGELLTFPVLTQWRLTHIHADHSLEHSAKIFCLLPHICKITPPRCTHPQNSQPRTNINKQTHTPTHTRRPPKSDRLANVLFRRSLSLKT